LGVVGVLSGQISSGSQPIEKRVIIPKSIAKNL